MSALTGNARLTDINEGHCGFTYSDDIKVKCQPKLNLSSKYFIGKLK